MYTSNDLVNKAIVCLAIETTLVRIGKPLYEMVIYELSKKYHCYLTDCYEHPEYLNEILKGLYGDAHHVFVERIKKELQEFTYKKSIERFLEIVSH